MTNIKIVPTLISKLSNNTLWCPVFQLIWNDLKNKVVGEDIVFVDDKSNQMMLDLNKETFKENDINDNYYYKKYGYMTPSLKDEIKTNIKKRFKEESDVLDKFEFKENSKDYFFYAILNREFTFIKPFDVISDNEFGITSNSNNELDNNIKVLYYKDYNNYAVKLLTTSLDEIILVKGLEGNNFLEIYENLNLDNLEEFREEDTISISKFDFKVLDNFSLLENRKFFIDSESHQIDKTLQVINFKFDNKGGKVKSEAGMSVSKMAYLNSRHFDFCDDFVLFIKEKDKSLPYLAIKVGNIENFK